MSSKLTAVSLFSGCGGFDWGVQKAGVEIVWANDIDPHAAAAYKSLFPDVEFVLDDISNISSFPKADILIGCYPCTGYSTAARRRWKNSKTRNLQADNRNFLYWHFIRAMGQIRPKYVFIENVMGMVSADEGWFLEEQMYHFRRLRYRPAQDKPVLLRSSDFGVPQSRERVFMVLIRKDVDFKYEFPKPTHGPGKRPPRVLEDVIWGMEEWPKGEYCEAPFHGHYLTRNRKRRWDEFSYTIVAHADHVPLHPMGKPMKKVGTDAWVLQGKKNRRLSWRECALIQDLPKKINPSGTLVQKYRVIGNAVPPAYGKALIKPVIAFESGAS